MIWTRAVCYCPSSKTQRRSASLDQLVHHARPPAHWRLQLAAKHLKSSELPIKIIADHARYESEAAFSRAFKRRFGVPPGDWRRRQAQGLG
jgi:AraC-like DNA-binding protein